jgi:hypothetical protein
MIITRQLFRRCLPLRSRRRQIQKNLLRELAQSFPRWLPLALHWKPASRRASPAAPRSEIVTRFDVLTNHLHVHFQAFVGAVLRQTFTQVLPMEKIFRSSERSAAPQLLYRVPSNAAISAHALVASRDSVAPPLRPIEPPVMPHAGPTFDPHRTLIHLPELRTTSSSRSPTQRAPTKPNRPEIFYDAPAIVSRRARSWSPVVPVERLHRTVARPTHPESRTSAPHAVFLSGAPELTWRKVPVPRPESADDAPDQQPRITGKAVVATAARTTVIHPQHEVETPLARKPALLSDLEPGFVDRLADDVIRRVERRARIERERRGL